MAFQTLSCPECGATVKSSAPTGTMVRCPKCKNTFRAEEEDPPAPPKKTAGAGERGVSTPRSPRGGGPVGKPRHREDDLESPRGKHEKPKASGNKTTVLVLAGLGAALLLTGGILIATGVFSSGDGDNKKNPSKPVAQNPSKPSPTDTGTPGPSKDPSAGGLGNLLSGKRWDEDPNDPRLTQATKPLVQEDKDPPPPESDFAGDKTRPFLVFDAQGHTALPRAALFTKDGKQAVTVAEDKTVRVWDVATGKPVHVWRLPAGPGKEGVPLAAALVPSGKHLAVAGSGYEDAGKILVLDLNSGKVVQTFTGHEKPVTGLSISRDGNWLASSSLDGSARVHSLQVGKTVPIPILNQGTRTIKNNKVVEHRDLFKAIAWAADGTLLATAEENGTATVWNTRTLAIVELKGHAGAVNCVAFNNATLKSMRLATGGIDGTIRLWAPAGDNRGIWKQTEDDGGIPGSGSPVPITSLTFTKDGKELLYTAGGKRGQTGLLSTENGRKRIEFKKHTNEVLCGALSPNGELALTSGGNDHESFLWRTKDGSVLQTLKSVGRSVWAVGCSPDGKLLAWGNTNKGDTTDCTTPLEHSFDLEGLALGPALKPDFLRARLTMGSTTLAALDAYQVAVRQGGQTRYMLQSPFKADRVYCFTLLPGGRAVVGTTEGLFLYDLTQADPDHGRKIIRTFKGHHGTVLSMAVSPNNRYFVTGSNDQTISIWHPARTEPIWTLFAAGRDWVAWTPEGYYAASAGGENMMGWLTNNGPDKLATFNPAQSFRQSLYNPGVLSSLWRAKGNIRTAVASVQGGTATLSVGKILPPEVAIRTPVADAKIDSGRVEVRASATSKGDFPVTSMRLLVDGRPYRGSQGIHRIAAPKLGEVEAKWNLELTPGKHILVVQAESKVSKALSPAVEVTRNGTPEVPDLYVLAVGISGYRKINPLVYAGTDPLHIRDAFKKLEGNGFIGKVEVMLRMEGQATRQGIEEGLDWLAKKMTPKDIGLFAFSGHGGRDEKSGEFHLCPIDMDGRDNSTGVSGSFITEKLGDMSGRVICMLDACHSGAAKDVKPVIADDLVRKLTGTDCGVVCMCAAASHEYAGDGDASTKAGVFTHAVEEGLAGAADLDRDGIIYLHELDIYIKQRVAELSGGKQNPTTGRPPELHSFPLKKL
ncbi:MAG: caspase family protein [Planctomycetes bacterium]|nr:caspase family protein [Planctomycetota bacterium]